MEHEFTPQIIQILKKQFRKDAMDIRELNFLTSSSGNASFPLAANYRTMPSIIV